jgi:hypothetical protein
METAKAVWVRTSNMPDCRSCKRIGREWLYKFGLHIVTRVNACYRCDAEEKVKALDSIPEKYR